MRGDIHHNKIIRSAWATVIQSYFVILWRLDFSVRECICISYLSMFWMYSLCVRGNNYLCLLSSYPAVYSPSMFCFFYSPFNILYQLICSWSFLSLSTMWWCLHPDASRRKRFRGCVTACPLTISLYSSHLTALMGFAPPLHSAADLVF